MYPPQGPSHLNVPLPDPAPLAPQSPQSGIEQAIPLMTSLFGIGQALGGSPIAGAAFLHGAHSAIETQTRDREIKAHQAQQEQLQLQQHQIEEQRLAQQAEAARAANIERFITTTQASLKGVTDKNQWEQQLAFADSIGQQFYGLGPNKLRGAVRYFAPDAKQKVAATLKAFVSNPINKGAIETGQNLPTFSIDTDGDGINDKPLSFAEAADYVKDVYPLAVSPNGGIMPAPKNTAPDKFDQALQIETENFTADKGHPPQTPQEKGLVYDKANKRAKTPAEPAPSITLNMPGMTPEDKVQSAADDLLNGRMAPSQLAMFFSGMGKSAQSQLKSAVMLRVKQQKPDFNFAEAESNYQFGKSAGTQNTVRYGKSVQETLPRLLDSATKLGNGQYRSLNSLINAGKAQVNDVDLKAFKTDVTFVADEVAKILQGGGTGSGTSDAKLKQGLSILSESDNPATIAASLKEIQFMLGKRIDSMTAGTYMDTGKGGDAEVWVRDSTGHLVKKPKGAP